MSRTARVQRSTAETRITLSLDLDGTGTTTIATGLGFFDHMLTHIGKHGRLDLTIAAEGDIHVDEHHLIEDVGLAFGRALFEALGEKRGIERFGVGFITMDEALARTVIDLSGRPHFVFFGEFSREMVNGFPTEMAREFFQAVANEAKMNLHVALLYGRNAHHQLEAVYKSFGRALRDAVRITGGESIPSTKGVL
jgi:imidazoleglycerol-phosphate dehydratase